MSDERTTHHIKMAKASTEEVDRLRRFLEHLEEMEDTLTDAREIGEWVIRHLPNTPWRRTVEGYSVMFDTACDPDPAITSLEWKPEIAAAMTAYAKSRDIGGAILSVQKRATEAVALVRLAVERCEESFVAGEVAAISVAELLDTPALATPFETWLDAVADRLPVGTVIGDYISVGRLLELHADGIEPGVVASALMKRDHNE